MPKKHDVPGLVGRRDVCFRTTPEMKLTKMYKPGVLSRAQWDLQILTDWRKKPEWWNAAEVVDASGTTHVFLDEVETMWDFENGYRIEIYGTAHFASGESKFLYRKFGVAPFDAKKIADSIFQQCAT